MIGLKIGSAIGKPVGRKIDGSTASGGGGATTSTFTVSDSNDNGFFYEAQYYDATPVTSYTSISQGGSVVTPGVYFRSSQNKYTFYAVYFRFANVTIPAGSAISTAKLKVDFVSGSERTYQINGFNEDNVNQPSSGSDGNHSNYTTANASWTVSASAAVHDSPEIKTIVQEIVDRSGWTSGNAMMFSIWLNSTQWSTYLRSLYLYNSAGDDPQLEITYS